MATYLLDGAGSARLPRRPLAVTLAVVGTHTSGVRLVARLRNGAEAPVLVHSPGMMIVPRIDQEIIIAAVPDSGRARFDEDTVLHVTIGPDSPADLDADYAELTPREVSGLVSIELATIAPIGPDQVAVTTRLAAPDAPLPPLSSRARVACRGALGVDSLPPERRVVVGCVIDASASLAPLVASGALAAAIDIVAGVAAVIGDSLPMRACLADGNNTEIPDGPLGELSGRVRQALDRSGYGVGANLDAAVGRIAGSTGLAVVITDIAIRPAQQAFPVNLLLLTESARRYPGFNGGALPPPPPGVSAEPFYDANPHLIDQAVAALVAPLRGVGVSR